MAKTVFITGSSSGFGKMTALLFARNGWNVVATMRNPKQEKQLQTYENILVLQLDVTKEKEIVQSVRQALKRFGAIDVLINNAGYGDFGFLENHSFDEVKKQFAVNAQGLIRVTQEVLPSMREHKEGCIINIASILGRVASPYSSLYASSKFAVEGFSEGLWYELQQENIRVKIIEPGAFSTGFGKHANYGQTHAKKELEQKASSVAHALKTFFREDTKKSGGKPEQVAKLLWKVARSRSSRLRYSIGTDAKLLLVLKRLFGGRLVRKALAARTMPKTKEEFEKLSQATWKHVAGEHKGMYTSPSWIQSVLYALGWQGKEFHSKQDVDALILQNRTERYRPWWGRAKLVEKKWRGKKTIAMTYTYLPITDYFKRVDTNTLMGAMTLFGIRKPVFYFYLRKITPGNQEE